jgi:hypothetical protein
MTTLNYSTTVHAPATGPSLPMDSTASLIHIYMPILLSVFKIFHAKELKALVPSPVLKSCLDDMALDQSGNGETFADSDDEDDDNKKKNKKKPDVNKAKESDDGRSGSLCFKAAKSSNASLYYVDHTKLKNSGDGLERDKRDELLVAVHKVEADETALKATLKQMTAETAKLLSEPTNEEATVRLETEESILTELKNLAEAGRKLKVNVEHKQKTKRRIENMAAQWRKRRRICMDFLIAMEENTEGTVSLKKCMAGDGQIDIDSDEVVATHAVAFGKKKRCLPNTAGKQKAGSLATKKAAASTESSGILLSGSEDFVAVLLDSQGCIKRVHLDDDKTVSTE